jgi:hypothetical protein
MRDSDATWLLPFEGEHFEVSPAAHSQVEEALAAMHQGAPLRTNRSHWVPLADAVEDRLSVPASRRLVNCRDPRTVQIVMAIWKHGRARDDRDVAAELGVDVELVERLRRLYSGRDSGRWSRHVYDAPVRAAVIAARNEGRVVPADLDCDTSWTSFRQSAQAFEGLVSGGGYRWFEIAPCHCCGGRRLAPMKLHEPVGPVCLDCRHDRAGLLWPADDYDRYIAHPQRWADMAPAHGRTSSPRRCERHPKAGGADPSEAV